MKYSDLSREALTSVLCELRSEYDGYCRAGLSLDLSRGKPCTAQLDLSDDLLTASLSVSDCVTETGFDCRNYGLLSGVPQMRKIFSDALGIPEDRILIGGNSSLNLIYDVLSRRMLFGTMGYTPWCRLDEVKFLCPVPGYDRHFRILETLGIRMIGVPMTPTGPDMDVLEALAADPAVKGMICVPKYANPTGVTFSRETVDRIARMKTAAPDFTLIWDNAYCLHDFGDTPDELADIFAACEAYGTEDRVMYFTSTSKMTYPGSGIAMVAASPKQFAELLKYTGVQTIGYDKINQIRQAKFLQSAEHLRSLMQAQARIIRPHFEIAEKALAPLREIGIADWVSPHGGYFISLDCPDGTAQRIFSLMKDAGVVLTSAGATFPYGKDPRDRNLRLAPTYSTLEDLAAAMRVLVCVVKLAAAEKLLSDAGGN